ncbi:MAG: protein kinase [Acidobacteria bacterium]|nr:protein kinase [Acidobacteriota bacterium]
MIGKTIAQYKIQEELGKGGMGQVYKAQDEQLDRTVVLKLLSSDLLTNDTARKRFSREARLASVLDHPNICMIYEIKEADSQFFIVMQYIEGQTLKQTINGQPLGNNTLISVALQIADALSSAHDHGIVHRDIKPQNIMITPRGQAKVLDFGLAKNIYEKNSLTRQLDMMGIIETPGTPAYMSPEQSRRDRIDRRSDIFSFGTVLYEMATGLKAFNGKNPMEIVKAVCNETPRPVPEINSGILSGFQEVLERAMAKDAEKRYQSMPEMIADLKYIGSEASSSKDVPDGIIKPFAPVERVRLSWLERLLPKSLRKTPKPNAVPTTPGGLLGVSLPSNTSSAKEPSLSKDINYSEAVTQKYEFNIKSTVDSPANMEAETSQSLLDDFPWIAGQHKTLAIMPSKRISGAYDESWGLELQETLIEEFTKFKSLSVRPSSQVAKYHNKEFNPTEVGHELGVDAILVTSFLSLEDKLYVMAQLFDTNTGIIVWSKKVDTELSSDNSVTHNSICQTLVLQLKEKGNPFELLQDPNEEIRIDAISKLKYSADLQAIEAIAQSLKDKSPQVKSACVKALSRFGRAATSAVQLELEKSMRTYDFDTARFAAAAAGRLGSVELVPMLLEALISDSSLLASEAALALGHLKDTRACPELLEALSRPDANIRFASAQALGELTDSQALPALEDRLRKDEDEGVRAKAFWAIKHIQKTNPKKIEK